MVQKRMLAVSLIQKHARRMNPQSVKNLFQSLLFQTNIFLFYSNRFFCCVVQKRMLGLTLIFVLWYRSACLLSLSSRNMHAG